MSDNYERSYSSNRVICSVIDEARKCHETRNYSYLPGLLEEIQVLANKMEAGLGDKHDLRRMAQERSKLKAEILKLREEKRTLAKSPANPAPDSGGAGGNSTSTTILLDGDLVK